MDNDTANFRIASMVITLILLFIVVAMYIKCLAGRFGENFVGKVPRTPIGNGMHYVYGEPGVQPTGQPMMYRQQLYEAKIPYYDDSLHNIGRPCSGKGGCGVFGTCADGTCTVNDKNNTVFNLKI